MFKTVKLSVRFYMKLLFLLFDFHVQEKVDKTQSVAPLEV